MKFIVYKILVAALLGWLAYIVMSLDEMPRLVIGCVLALAALTMTIVSRVQLGKAFTVRIVAKELVTTGDYSKIRHPMFLFVDLTLLGLIIISHLSFIIVVWFFFVSGQSVRAWKEEEVLTKAFGAEYEKYRSRTWF